MTSLKVCRTTPKEMIRAVLSLLVVTVLISPVDGQCATEDFSIKYGNNVPFSVSQSNLTCICPHGFFGKHIGDGAQLTNLTAQPDFSALAAQYAALQSQLTTLLTTIGTNECATNNGGCGSRSCKDLWGAPPLCYCPAGYVEYPPGQCSDFNECVNNATLCGASGYATCTNLPGTWSCSCAANAVMLNGYCVPTIPAPGSLLGVNYNKRVALSWTAPSTSLTIVNYVITVSPAPAAGSATRSVGSATLSFMFYNLTNGVSYTFTIYAEASSASSGIASSPSAAVVPNPRLITAGLVYHLDAGNSASYPGSGTAWNDLVGNGPAATLSNQRFVGSVGSPSAYLESTAANTVFQTYVPHAQWMTDSFSGGTKRWMIEEVLMTYTTTYPEANAGSVASDNAYSAGSAGFDWQHGVAIPDANFRMGMSCAETLNPSGGYDDDVIVTLPSSSVIAANVWQHRLLYWDRLNNHIGLFVNGVKYGPVSTTYVNGYSIYDGGGIIFGALYGWKHNGRRSIIRVYNRMLSNEEAEDNFLVTRSRFGL